MKQQDGYIKGLDGVRGIAILLVLTFHSGLLQYGWVGVQLFFVLSGFLITSILLKERALRAPVGEKLKRFWVRRSLRIFPVYFIYLLFLGATWLFFSFPSYYPDYAPYLFTYTVNYTRLMPGWQGNPLFTHLWSLSIEEQFYLFFPLLVFFLPSRMLKYLLLVCILLAPLIRHGLFLYYHQRTTEFIAADAVYWNTLSHLDAFFLGALLPVWDLPSRIRRPGVLLFSALLVLLLTGLLHYRAEGGSGSYFTDLGYSHLSTGGAAHVWRYSVLNLFFALLILFVVRPGGATGFRRLFELPLLVRIGRVSYGMYILHWAVFVYLFDRFSAEGAGAMILFLPYLAVVYGLAELSYHLIEIRFLRMKEKLVPKKGRRPVSPPEN